MVTAVLELRSRPQVAEPDSPSPFAAYLAGMMAQRHLNKNQVAAFADVSPNTVAGWLRGVEPKRASLEKLADKLGVPFDELVAAAFDLDKPRTSEVNAYYDTAAERLEAWLAEGADILRHMRRGQRPSP